MSHVSALVQAIVRILWESIKMLRWMIAVGLALVLFSSAMPFLRKFGIGRLPGDLNFTLFGKLISVPFTSTIVLSLIAAGIAKLI
jgi:hypothetical protein